MSYLRTLRSWLDVVEQLATSLALVGILGLIFLGVILRYFFASGITWGEEIARVIFIGMTYVAISRVCSNGVHFRVTLIEDLLPGAKRYARVVAGLVQLCLLALLTYLAAGNGLFIRQMGQTLPASGLSAYLFYVPIVVGLALGTLRAGSEFVSAVAGLRRQGVEPAEYGE